MGCNLSSNKVMDVSHFTDARIAEIYGGDPLTKAERAFLMEDTPTFEGCDHLKTEMVGMTDKELMQTAYGVWADYANSIS